MDRCGWTLGRCCRTCCLGEQWEFLKYLVPKVMLDGNIHKLASSKRRSRISTILLALTKRQSCCQRWPQQDFLDTLPAPLLENTIGKRQDPTFVVEPENASPVLEVVVAQHVVRALRARDSGVGEAWLANSRIPLTPMARTLIPTRVQVAM